MNASENPFATGRVERLLRFDPELMGSSWAAIDERWSQLGHRACVTGHHGSGKTSFLDAMAARLAPSAQVGRLFFNDRKRSLSTEERDLLENCTGIFLLVDGDGFLGWRERRELLKKSAASRGSLFARHRSGGLPEVLRLRSNPDMAKVLLARISPRWCRQLEGDLNGLWRRKKGNLREMWLECFDLAGRTES